MKYKAGIERTPADLINETKRERETERGTAIKTKGGRLEMEGGKENDEIRREWQGIREGGIGLDFELIHVKLQCEKHLPSLNSFSHSTKQSSL